MFFWLFVVIFLKFSSAGCANNCNYHGYCTIYDQCICFLGRDGSPAYVGSDCSERACPKGRSWGGEGLIGGANDAHPLVECSNRGECDRRYGTCNCELNFEGYACERTVCPYSCNNNGECITLYQLAADAGREYSTPWDSTKQTGCVCDIGFRGPDCSLKECPSTRDPLRGLGNESGRDCSGRGICNYKVGLCECFYGYYGDACQFQETLLQ